MGVERETLIERLEPEVAGLGYELLDLEGQRGRGAVLRLFIDAPGGVGLDDCERVSRAVGALLDVEDLMPGPYRLEVSSPGPERPLRTAGHFAAVIGQVARLRVMRDGRLAKLRGRVESVGDGAVNLDCEGERVSIPLADIVAARLVPAVKAAVPAKKSGRQR